MRGKYPDGKPVWTGRKHSLETREKISAANKGKTSPNKGRTFSAEWRKKLSLAHKGHKPTARQIEALAQGRKINHQMTGGVEKIPGYRSWKKNENGRRKRSNGGSHTFGEWQTLKAQYNWRCPACTKQEPEIKLTQDHIIPISKGGSDNIENIQPLCLPCNISKMTKFISYPVFPEEGNL